MSRETTCAGQGCGDCTVCRLRAEVATLTAQRDNAVQNAVQVIRSRQTGKSIATEVLQLRSRLSTVERERDEGRGLLQDVREQVPTLPTVLAIALRAYLSRSPVEGGRET